MTAKVSFHRLAEQELNESALYYSLESPGLGGAFLDEIHRCIESILRSPEAGPIIRRTVRRRLAHRFPFAVLYSINTEEVRVLAIMHMKRRPMYWAGRR